MNPEFPGHSLQSADEYARMRLAPIQDSDFELAEKVLDALFNFVPGNHPIRQDNDVAEFIDVISNAENFLSLLPAITFDNGQVTHRSASPDLPAAEIDMANYMAPLLGKIRVIAGKIEAAGFSVYTERN